MAGGQPDQAGAGAPSAEASPQRDHPDVLAVCRWLPQPYPSGAFTGRHDRVHAAGRHGLAVLWWADRPMHVGDYVGPPRGGLAPGAKPSYDVAMPAGGYLHVRSGILEGWRAHASARLILRADGEAFSANGRGPDWPYFAHDYSSMSDAECAAALARVSDRRPVVQPGRIDPVQPNAGQLVQAVRERIEGSSLPTVCACDADVAPETCWPDARTTNIPTALLRHGGAMATLAGLGSPDDAADMVWSLTEGLADPTRVGAVTAVETAARRSAVPISGWPDAPLTEEAVALVAAQAVRWHGFQVLTRLPFWTLGWIFLAEPLLDRLFADLPPGARPALRQSLLDNADAVRLHRTHQVWLAANDATAALAEMSRLMSGDDPLHPADIFPVVDVRDSASKRRPTHVPEPRGPINDRAYAADVATVVASLVAG